MMRTSPLLGILCGAFLVLMIAPVMGGSCAINVINGTCVYQGTSSAYIQSPPTGQYWVEVVDEGVPYGSYVNYSFQEALLGDDIYQLNVSMATPAFMATQDNFTFNFGIVSPTGQILSSSTQYGTSTISALGGTYSVIIQPIGQFATTVLSPAVLANGIQTTISTGFSPFTTTFNTSVANGYNSASLINVWYYPGAQPWYVVPFSSISINSQYASSSIYAASATAAYYDQSLAGENTALSGLEGATGGLFSGLTDTAWNAASTTLESIPVIGPVWTIMIGSSSIPGLIPIVLGEVTFWLTYVAENFLPLALLIETIFVCVGTILGLKGTVIMYSGHGINLPKSAQSLGPPINLINFNIILLTLSFRGLSWAYDKGMVGINTLISLLPWK
jgi:hypothetical protein